MQNKPNLPNAQMNATSLYTKDYENKRLADMAKTKPKQSQYKANTNPIPEKPKMNVTSILTKDYRKNDAFAVQKNKPNSNPIKPNFKPDTYAALRQSLPGSYTNQRQKENNTASFSPQLVQELTQAGLFRNTFLEGPKTGFWALKSAQKNYIKGDSLFALSFRADTIVR